jgi:hypothetical protein
MLKRNITHHISGKRLNRAVFIQTTIGVGEIIKEQKCVAEDGRIAWQCLTDTGVIIVLDEQKEVVITLYIAELPKVSAMYQGKTPSWVINKVRKNKQYAKMQDKVKM